MRIVLILVAALSGCVHLQDTRRLVEWEPSTPLIVFHDVRVFTATSTEVLEHHDVEVRAGRIVDVRPTGSPIPEGARVFEGEGRTLLPGLVDAHAHTHVTGAPPWYVVIPEPEHALQEAIYAGTTTIHDMGGPTVDVLKLRAMRPDFPKPRMLVSGMMLTAKGGYPGSYIKRVLPEWLTGVMLSRYAR